MAESISYDFLFRRPSAVVLSGYEVGKPVMRVVMYTYGQDIKLIAVICWECLHTHACYLCTANGYPEMLGSKSGCSSVHTAHEVEVIAARPLLYNRPSTIHV